MQYLGEFLGTMVLMILGLSINANVSLAKTKGNGSGWLVISLGWAAAVMVAVMMFDRISGAHFNPAVTVGLAMADEFPWASVPFYLLAQMAGAIVGAVLVWVKFRLHFDATEDKDKKLGVFSTSPAIRSLPDNFFAEFLGTFVLVFAVVGALELAPLHPGPIGIGGIILAIGAGMGGTTGYAINPARDLGPRIAYAFVPIKNKRNPDWGYAFIPVVAPLLGGLAAGLVGKIVFGYGI